MENTKDLGLRKTCGFTSMLEDHFKTIHDRDMINLAKTTINATLDLSDSINIEANTKWIKLMMPGYYFGIGPLADGFNLAFRSKNIDLGKLTPYRNPRGKDEDWIYVEIRPEAQITVEDIMEIVKKVNRVPADINDQEM